VAAYRFHLGDAIGFRRSLRFEIEHGHANTELADARRELMDEQEQETFDEGAAWIRIFAGLKITLAIEVATDVVAHNATRAEGRKLAWQYDYATLKEASPGREEGMWVRFRK